MFLVWVLVMARRFTPIQASHLVNTENPIALQMTNTNGGLYAAILVHGDAVHGGLRTATRHTKTGEGRGVILPGAIADDLEAMYATWCGGIPPTMSRPQRGYYEIAVFCGEGRPLLQLYFPLQDAPSTFAEIERLAAP
jgi:hypothetical protein